MSETHEWYFHVLNKTCLFKILADANQMGVSLNSS